MHQTMTENHNPTNGTPARKAGVAANEPVPQPDWANGLRNIYNSVVSEPLPTDMLKLLASLDEEDDHK